MSGPTYPARTADDIKDCFEATCVEVFAACCRASRGDLDRADGLLIDTFLSIRANGLDAVDVPWLLTEVSLLSGGPLLGDTDDEHWLDDVTRARARQAIETGIRPLPRGDVVASADQPRPLAEAMGRHDPPRARHGRLMTHRARLTVTIAVVAAGCTGMAALSLVTDPGSDRRSGRADTADTAAIDTGRSPSDPERPSAPTRFVVDSPPSGFRAAGAYDSPADPADGWFQLWAAARATRTSGRWLAIATITQPSGRPVLTGGQWIEINGLAALEAVDDDGVVEISMDLPDGNRFTIAGFGFGPAGIRTIATGIAIDRGTFSYRVASEFIDDGLRLLVSAGNPSGQLDSQVYAGPRSSSSYQSNDLTRRLSVSGRPSTPNDLLIAQFLLRASPTGAPGRVTTVGSRAVVVNAETSYDGKVIHTLQWHDGDSTITMSGTADLASMIAAIPSVRPATAQEWHDLLQLPPSYLST